MGRKVIRGQHMKIMKRTARVQALYDVGSDESQGNAEKSRARDASP
jgi:hypothetical protein